MNFLRTRRREPEWMDDPDADPALLHKSLVFIKWVNRVFGYTRVVLRRLGDFSAKWDAGETIRIIDVGTGSADIPLAILRWADKRGQNVQIVGIDLNPVIAKFAADESKDPRLTIVRGDAMHLPFADGSFDYAITSMFLHHLDESEAERTLAEMGRVSKRGVIISDLLRMRHAYLGICLLTLFSNPMVKHDARISVAQAFSRAEILAIRDRAGLKFANYSNYIGHRFVLAGKKAARANRPEASGFPGPITSESFFPPLAASRIKSSASPNWAKHVSRSAKPQAADETCGNISLRHPHEVMKMPSQRRPKSQPPPVSNEGQLALWSAANLAGMQTGHLVVRAPFFQRLLNKLIGKRRRRVLRMRRPSPQQSLPMLAEAVVGSSRSTLVSVFGPPRSAAVSRGAHDGVISSFWEAQTWYYPLPRQGPMAMAITFDDEHANGVEFFQMPLAA